RAARLQRPGVRFFEVDHPASQADKKERLAGLPGYPMDAARFVACDFEQDDFSDRLFDAGHDPLVPTCFVWEGVVYYLVEEAARETLGKLARDFDPRSMLVFDFLNSHLANSSDRLRDEDRAMKGIVEELGEPMRFGIDDATPLMHDAGFRLLRTVSYDEIALQYTGTYDRDRYFRFQSIGVASASEEALRW
ncbi:MAG: SAM-dependent methyltransferase, partial [Polyangiales bacterium]